MADEVRLIDANKLKQRIEFICKDERNPLNITAIAYFALLELVDIMPTVEAEPVKHGRWILSDDKNWVTCPFCDADVDVSVGILVYVDNEEVNHINFCPNCGAKMDFEG